MLVRPGAVATDGVTSGMLVFTSGIVQPCRHRRLPAAGKGTLGHGDVILVPFGRLMFGWGTLAGPASNV
jgi:hypothetical protein